jgi:hypothetical protein
VRGLYEQVDSFILKDSLNTLDILHPKGVLNPGILMEDALHLVNGDF